LFFGPGEHFRVFGWKREARLLGCTSESAWGDAENRGQFSQANGCQFFWARHADERLRMWRPKLVPVPSMLPGDLLGVLQSALLPLVERSVGCHW
jgi:hypothetical protein